ncbi:hypothetical protein BYT27DRAFT_7094999 [Phlegmacium glaucopus]|nr:hypothetical protein BYT27DRAFT_7094999 [Phlegmacium glaucopus]
MALSIAVHPLTPTLDMYGESDPSAAYSLSGHVSISVSSSSSFSLFDHRKTARLLLQSVSLTFEGQSEIFTPTMGYSSLRLCSVTRELAPSEPIELSNEGSGEPCIWNVIFNLPIPGWLPPTTTLDIEDIGIRYSLYATATFTNLDDDQQSSWSFVSLCAPFRSRLKLAHGQKEIHLRRFISAPRADVLNDKTVTYLVDSHTSSPASISSKPRMPVEVLNKIQVLASVPEYANVAGNTLPLTLRMRTKDLCEEDCKKLQVTEVVVDILQQEKTRIRPSSGYLLRYPIPPQEMQPPNLPLLDPHTLSSIYDAGLFVGSDVSESFGRTFSLLPSELSGTFKLAENNYVFADDHTPQELPTWYTMDAVVPFVQCSTAKADAESPEWTGSPIRPSLSSPLYSVYHDISISLTCAFDLPSGEIAYEQLKFNVPVTFANVAPNPPPLRAQTPPPAHSSSSADAAAASTSTTSPSSLSYPTSTMSHDLIPFLPAYSHLYDFNGERKIDYSTPLPLYSPRSSTETLIDVCSSASASLSSDSHLDFTNVCHDNHDYNVKR